MSTTKKYCYVVDHPEYGTRVFYSGDMFLNYAAKSAIDYAENLVPVMKVPLIDDLQKSIDERNTKLQTAISEAIPELSPMG